MTRTLLLLALASPVTAWACGGGACACQSAANAEVKADHTAQKMLGNACPHATSAVVKRVLDEGTPWTFAGTLRPADNEKQVATPYEAGPDAVKVLANKVLEDWAGGEPAKSTFEGRRLDVDGTTYFVITNYSAASS